MGLLNVVVIYDWDHHGTDGFRTTFRIREHLHFPADGLTKKGNTFILYDTNNTEGREYR